MKTMAVGDLKSHFSEVLALVQNGDSVAIGFGRLKRKVAVIVPYKDFKKAKGRKLGLLQAKAAVHFKADFKLADESFLAS